MKLNQAGIFENGGGTGIRTLGRLLTFAGFQDQCFQPLSHPSAGTSSTFALLMLKIAIKIAIKSGGGTGIRTLGRLLTFAGFQDQCFQPLSHPSATWKDTTLNRDSVNVLIHKIFLIDYILLKSLTLQR